MALGQRDYAVVIPIRLRDETSGGSRAVRSSVDRTIKDQLNAIEKANNAQARSERQAAAESKRILDQKDAAIQKSIREQEKAADRAAKAHIKEEDRAAREVRRINRETARQAEQQEGIRQRLHKEFSEQRQRLIKREQDVFLRAEAEKTAAARAAGAAQVRSMEATKAAMIGAWSFIKTAALAVFAAIGVAGAGLGLAISRAMSFDVLERGLGIVAGTAEEAQKQLTRLKELARLPGLGLREAIQASIALQIGFQQSIKDTSTRVKLAEETIKQFSNAIALTGGGPEVFQRVIMQLTQMSNAGKVLMSDLRPIIQAAPAIGQALVKAFGTIDPKEINELGLTTEQFMTRLNTALATLPRATDSAANAWTNFTNAFDVALVAIGKPFLDPLTKALAKLEPMLTSLGDQIGALFTKLGQDAGTLWANLPAATKAAFQDMWNTVTSMGGQIVQWFKTNYPLIQAAVTNVLNQIAIFWQAHGTRIKEIAILTIGGILEPIKAILQALTGDWSNLWKTLSTIVQVYGTALQKQIVLVIRMIFDLVLAQKDLLAKAGKAIGEALLDGIISGIKSKAGALALAITGIANPIVPLIRTLWQIKSPSLVFMRIGEQVIEGLIVGFQNKAGEVQQTLADILDIAAGKFTKAPKKPAETAAKQIAHELREQAEALRKLSGETSAVDRMNRLLADPLVAKRIDGRTAALLRMSAAMKDAAAATRERTVGLPGGMRSDPDATRGRVAGPGAQTRDRFAFAPDPAEIELTRFYGSVIDDLNSKLHRHGELTQVQITLQQLERAGLGDLTDARAREALAIAGQIDREMALANTRNQIAGWADDVSSIFGRAIDQWDGSFKGFFRSIKNGFADMLRRMIADFAQAAIFSRLKGFLEGLFKVGAGQSGGGILGGGGSGGGIMGAVRNLFGGGSLSTGGFSGGGGASSVLGRAFSGGALGGAALAVPPSLSAAGPSSLSAIAQQFSGGAASGAASAIPGAGMMAGLAGMLPLLGLTTGAGLGASLGGQSGLGRILGGLGGAGIGGALGMAAFTAMGGLVSPALAGFMAIAGPAALIIGPLLLIGAHILAKNKQRQEEEKKRNEWGIDARANIYTLLAQAQTGDLTVAQARVEWDRIGAAYMAHVNTLKDSKTRRNATLWWQHVSGTAVDPGGATVALWPMVEAAARESEQRANRRARMSPVFASGGFSTTSQLIRVRPGEGWRNPGSSVISVIPGRDLGYDSKFMYAEKGTQIIPKNEMRNSRGFLSGGVVGSDGASLNTLQIDSLELNLDADGLATVVIKSKHFKAATIHNVKVGKLEGKL